MKTVSIIDIPVKWLKEQRISVFKKFYEVILYKYNEYFNDIISIETQNNLNKEIEKYVKITIDNENRFTINCNTDKHKFVVEILENKSFKSYFK